MVELKGCTDLDGHLIIRCDICGAIIKTVYGAISKADYKISFCNDCNPYKERNTSNALYNSVRE